MPFSVWQFFCRSFEKNLPVFFVITKADAKSIMAKAKEEYKEIIEKLPDSFEVWQLFFARKEAAQPSWQQAVFMQLLFFMCDNRLAAFWNAGMELGMKLSDERDGIFCGGCYNRGYNTGNARITEGYLDKGYSAIPNSVLA